MAFYIWKDSNGLLSRGADVRILRRGDIQMIGSKTASEIDYDYKMRKKYETKRAKKCKDRECRECKLSEVCTESEEKK